MKYLFFTFLKIGSTSFGGFMALIAVVQNQLVDKDKKISSSEILDRISLASVLPGPIAVNVVTSIGYALRGIPGAIVSMIAIVIPSFILITILSVIYFKAGEVPAFNRFFMGVLPAICAIIVAVAFNMGRKNIKDFKQVFIAIAAGAVLIFTKGFLITLFIIAAGGFLGFTLYYKKSKQKNQASEQKSKRFRVTIIQALVATGVLIVLILFYFTPWIIGERASQNLLVARELLYTFGTLSVTMFGGGYVVIPALQEIFVENLGWLSNVEFADGIAMGQITPGPIYISAAFIGYKVLGVGGALLATLAVFIPASILMIIASHYLHKVTESKVIAAIFKGLRPAVIGMIFASAFTIAKSMEMVWPSFVIIGIVLVLQVRFKISAVILIPAAGIAGLLLFQL